MSSLDAQSGSKLTLRERLNFRILKKTVFQQGDKLKEQVPIILRIFGVENPFDGELIMICCETGIPAVEISRAVFPSESIHAIWAKLNHKSFRADPLTGLIEVIVEDVDEVLSMLV